MKIFIYMVCSLVVMTMAYWAYTENYTTQASIRRVEELNRLVSDEQEALSILNAEWAYLNRPERLSNLADLNFTKLKLVPLAAQHFNELDIIVFLFPHAIDEVKKADISISSFFLNI